MPAIHANNTESDSRTRDVMDDPFAGNVAATVEDGLDLRQKCGRAAAFSRMNFRPSCLLRRGSATGILRPSADPAEVSSPGNYR
jgi:hypothetical protein